VTLDVQPHVSKAGAVTALACQNLNQITIEESLGGGETCCIVRFGFCSFMVWCGLLCCFLDFSTVHFDLCCRMWFWFYSKMFEVHIWFWKICKLCRWRPLYLADDVYHTYMSLIVMILPLFVNFL